MKRSVQFPGATEQFVSSAADTSAERNRAAAWIRIPAVWAGSVRRRQPRHETPRHFAHPIAAGATEHACVAATTPAVVSRLSGSSGDGGTDGPDLGVARSVGVVTGRCVSVKVAVCREDGLHVQKSSIQFTLTRKMCNETGWEYEVFTGLIPEHSHNLRWLAGYRHDRKLSHRRSDTVYTLCASKRYFPSRKVFAGRSSAVRGGVGDAIFANREVTADVRAIRGR